MEWISASSMACRMVMSFKFPHLHSDKFFGLFDYKLSLQLGKLAGFCFAQRIKKAGPRRKQGRGLSGRQVGQVWLTLNLYLLHSLCSSPGSSVRPVSLVLVISVWLMFPPLRSKGIPVASEVWAVGKE